MSNKTKLMYGYMFGLGAALLSASFGASAGISGSRHDLTSSGTASNKVSGTGANGDPEICAFCHTPHAAVATTTIAAPLWNKAISSTTLTNYSSTTMDGTVTSGGMSLACLSCHDGTQAMDVMVNVPGRDGQSAGASAYSGAGYSWTNANRQMISTSYANLSADLTNDHPIQVPYCGGGMAAAGSANGLASVAACNDLDFFAPKQAGTSGVYYFDASGDSKRQKEEILVYSRNSGYFVECGSCHDPHNTSTNTFLRKSNAASAVCLTCHNK